MIFAKPLPKRIREKMTKSELIKHDRLIKEDDKLYERMDNLESEAADYSRKVYKMKNPTAAQLKKEQKMAEAGFRAMFFSRKKADELHKFKKNMKTKYT